MKKIFLLFSLFFTFSFTLFSQNIIDNPKCGLNLANGLTLNKIEISDTATVLSFTYRGTPGTWVLIPGGSCIQPVGSEKRHYITRTEGIPFGKQYWLDNSGLVEYKAFFPPIDPKTERIDFLEDNDGGSWFIYDIWLSEMPKTGKIPPELQNIWFDTAGSKQMIIALYDTVAVYKSGLWSYGDMKQKGSVTQLELVNDENTHTLFFESVDEHICKMGTSSNKMVELYDWPQNKKGYKLPGDEPYSAPILNNGEAVFSGYIRNYTPRAGFVSGLIHANNAIIGEQESYIVKIEPNGYFSASVPLVNPEEVYLDIPFMHRTVFLEPGKETFQLVDGASVYNGLLYQGEMAPINNGLFEMKDINFMDYREFRDSVLKIDPEEYKVYFKNIRDREMLAMKDTIQKKFISQKARQVKEKNIQFRYYENLLSYSMQYRSALQQQNKDGGPVALNDIPKPEPSYYNFLTPDLLNNELGLLSNTYYFFTNRLKYSDLLRDNTQLSFTFSEFVEALKQKGVELTPDELVFIEKTKKIDEHNSDWTSFNEKYRDILQSFITKYQDSLSVLNKDESFSLWHDVEEFVNRNGQELTANEKEMIDAAQKIQSREDAIALREFQKQNEKELQAFYNKYSAQQNTFIQEKREKARAKAMKEKLGTDEGLVVDIMNAQDKLRGIVEELTPVTDNELNNITAGFSTPFIADYIRYCNEQTIRKVAELKEKSDYIVKQVPKVDSDQLFEKMMEKFKGKVAFVDFWATWCGPCRSGMQRIKPLKEELKGKPIVFVYITNETSPEVTWKNMVAEIGGEHYRVNRDEWNILSNRFGISGIPHYVLVDKDGKVAKNNGMSVWDQGGMKKLFEEFMMK
ncbi:MAG: TlpA family protein disulfide reductase [Prolixibacteraceae bacterium]|nr:TlpA family protein disulfide reductase [Prolixibacteraceae bacterium]